MRGMVGDVTSPRRGLLAAAVLMLALSGSLAFVLSHDAVGAGDELAAAAVGQETSLKGTFAPYFVTPAATDARWAPVHAVLGNMTYVQLDQAQTGADGHPLVVLVTSDALHGDMAGVIVRGPVVLRMPHPDGSGRTLVVLRATAWARPLVFG